MVRSCGVGGTRVIVSFFLLSCVVSQSGHWNAFKGISIQSFECQTGWKLDEITNIEKTTVSQPSLGRKLRNKFCLNSQARVLPTEAAFRVLISRNQFTASKLRQRGYFKLVVRSC